jgi:hypothetical protein
MTFCEFRNVTFYWTEVKTEVLVKRIPLCIDVYILYIYIYTVPVKRLDTPTHSRVFLYFYYFLHCTIIVKTSKL